VTSGLAGAAVTVEDGATGRLLEDPEDDRALGEAIEWALSGSPADPETASESVQRYAWPQVVTRYTEILEREVRSGG
jgi:glycosyltransferase involved in cell wall biosynthesis